MLLKNKNVIITGATRGIGKGIALEFAKQGANIIFTYSRSHDEAKKLEDELNNHAEQGWRVINVYNNSNGIINAVLEKDKK